MSRIDKLTEIQSPFVEGTEYRFDILRIGDPVQTQKSHYRQWKFGTFIDGENVELKMNLFPFMVIPIAECLGCKKEGNEVTVDYDEIEGKSIMATVFFQNKFPALKDFKAVNNEETIPF